MDFKQNNNKIYCCFTFNLIYKFNNVVQILSVNIKYIAQTQLTDKHRNLSKNIMYNID